MFTRIKKFLFENQSLRQTVMKNAFWLNFGEITSRLIRAVVIIYAARIIGAAGYGVFSYALNLAGLFTIFSDIGISSILTREAAKNPETRTQYLSTAFFIKLCLIASSVIMVIFIAPFFTKIKESVPLLPVIALLLAFDSLRDFAFSFVRALEKMQVEAGIKIFTNTAIVALGFLALFISATSRSFTIGYTLGSGLGLAAAIWTLRKEFGKVFSHFRKELIYPILSSAWPFALFGLLGGIMINTDMIMLGWFQPARDLGFYAAAYKPVQLFWIFPALLASSFFPILSRLAYKDDGKFRLIFEKSMAAVFLVGLPLVAGGLILGRDFIRIIFGNEYLPAVSCFRILLLTVLLVFPGSLIGNAVFCYDKQKSLIGYFLLGALGNVAFNFLFIPVWGINGAAIATIFTQIISNGFSWRKMKRINDFHAFRHLPKIFAATALMVLSAWGLNALGVNFFVNLLISILIYFGLLHVLKEPLLVEGKTAIAKILFS
ncbi:MAG: flippase [Candidatus Paceibacterota bacterium]